MTQDSTTYYVWIGGSCDYGHKIMTSHSRKKSEKTVQLHNEELQLIPISNKQAVIVEDSNIQIKEA